MRSKSPTLCDEAAKDGAPRVGKGWGTRQEASPVDFIEGVPVVLQSFEHV